MKDEAAVGATGATGPYIPPRTIQQRMIAILAEMPAIGKTQRNVQQGFMFRGHDDVLNALNPLLAKHGVFVVPNVIDRITAERKTQRGGTMYEVNLHVQFTFHGEGGDRIVATTWGEGTDSGDKATNKAMTMAFKNVLNQAFAISSEEFSDSDADTDEETTRVERSARTEGRDEDGFDPGQHLLETAIEVKTPGDATTIRRALASFDGLQQWDAIEEFCSLHQFGKGRNDLSRPQTAEFWRRLANAVAKIGDLAGPGDFPPPSRQQIVDGFAWAFSGVVLALGGADAATEPEPDAEPSEPEEAAQEAAE